MRSEKKLFIMGTSASPLNKMSFVYLNRLQTEHLKYMVKIDKIYRFTMTNDLRYSDMPDMKNQ